jgi:uncharacterized protein YciI
MARAQLYVLTITRTSKYGGSGPDEAASLMREHLLYLWQLEVAGTLFGAGPLERSDDAAGPVGMIIVAAPSREAAEVIAANEPFHRAGWRVNTVRGWTLNEGASAFLGKMMAGLAAHEASGKED